MEGNLRFSIFDNNIISDVFGDEVVLVNLETGVYFSLRASATQVWIRLQNSCSIDEIVAELASMYEVDGSVLAQDSNNFIAQLLEKQLLKVNPSGEKISIEANQNSGKIAYVAPVLEVFSDMQEILLLDPVHDVDKAGWPVSKDINPSK